MAGFEKLKPELDALGVKIVAASVDPLDKAQEVAAGLSFPVAYGVTRATADLLDWLPVVIQWASMGETLFWMIKQGKKRKYD